MVFYFQSASDEKAVIYMGKDKFENEELLKHAFPKDIWFHVDDLSSAHLYLRGDYDPTAIPPDLLEDICQLTKHNSIQGSKLQSCTICYTLATNLKKNGEMDVGQVGFKNPKLVRREKISKDKFIVNRLNKTKREEYPDLQNMLLEHQKSKRRQERDANPKFEKSVQKEEVKVVKATGYEEIHKEENMYSNKGLAPKSDSDFDDDFM